MQTSTSTHVRASHPEQQQWASWSQTLGSKREKGGIDEEEDGRRCRARRRVREVSRQRAKRRDTSRSCMLQTQPNNPVAATTTSDPGPHSSSPFWPLLVILTSNLFPPLTPISTSRATMISHATLYNLANSLGMLAMFTVVLYHVVAVNARHLEKSAHGSSVTH